MPRQTVTQRWCSVVATAVLISLLAFYGLPELAYRMGRAHESGRIEVAAEQALAVVQASEQAQAEFVSRLTDHIRPAVVRLELSRRQNTDDEHRGSTRRGSSHDTDPLPPACGLIVDARGLVLTNCEPLSSRPNIRLHLANDEGSFDATLLACDPETDLAVVEFDPHGKSIPVATFSDGVLPGSGDTIVAVGNAHRVDHWLWLGSVQVGGRAVGAAGCCPQDFIQTNAAGLANLGGPLVNLRGEVVGINTSWCDAEGNPTGLAVPSPVAQQVYEELRDQGRVLRGWLGVSMHAVHPVPQADFPQDAVAISLDYVFPDSPAARSGLQVADLLLRLNGHPLHSVGDLRKKIASAAARAELRFSLLRDGQQRQEVVRAEPRPTAVPRLPGEQEWGIRPLCYVPPEARKCLGSEAECGVVVDQVTDRVQDAGLNPGDVILQVNDAPLKDFADFCQELDKWRSTGTAPAVQLTVCSRGTRKQIELPVSHTANPAVTSPKP